MLDEAQARQLYGDEAVRIAARHDCWRRGDLRYLLHDGQLEALRAIGRSRWRRFILNVGRRWGKSVLMVVVCAIVLTLRALWRRGEITRKQIAQMYDPWIVHAATRTKKRARVLYAAPTANMIEEFVAPHFEWLASHAPPDLRIELHKGDYVNPDGDRVVMSGCEDRKKANRLRGPEADMAIADEGGFIPILGYVVKSAIGFQLAETRGRLLMPSTPPESPDHPFVDFVAEAQERGSYYHATTADAPHITDEMLEEAIEDAGGIDSVTWRREGEAEIVRDPEIVVLPEFGEHLVGEHPRPEHFTPAIVGDMGFTDMTVILFGYYDFEADLYVIEREVAGQRVVSDDLRAQIDEAARVLWPAHVARGDKITRRLDGTARERAELSSEGDETFAAVSRDTKDRGGRMRTLANRARIVCKQARLVVHPDCTTTIAHMKFARWNTQRTSFQRVKDEQGNPVHHYDGCAACLYFIRDVDATTNPFPVLPPGVHPDTHWISPELRQRARRPQRLAERFRR